MGPIQNFGKISGYRVKKCRSCSKALAVIPKRIVNSRMCKKQLQIEIGILI